MGWLVACRGAKVRTAAGNEKGHSLPQAYKMRDIRSMRIAIATATPLEWEGLKPDAWATSLSTGPHHLTHWLTGVGLLHTACSLATRIPSERPDLVVQVGLGGSFNIHKHPLGTAVGILRETQADLGVQESTGWKDAFQMGWMDPHQPPYLDGWLVNPHQWLWELAALPMVKGVSVNSVSSEPYWIEALVQRLQPDVESMEGAALHATCLMSTTPFLQIRGLSNRVGERDKSQWRIAEALEAARAALQRCLAVLPENGIR